MIHEWPPGRPYRPSPKLLYGCSAIEATNETLSLSKEVRGGSPGRASLVVQMDAGKHAGESPYRLVGSTVVSHFGIGSSEVGR